jgi:hypothetical protein
MTGIPHSAAYSPPIITQAAGTTAAQSDKKVVVLDAALAQIKSNLLSFLIQQISTDSQGKTVLTGQLSAAINSAPSAVTQPNSQGDKAQSFTVRLPMQNLVSQNLALNTSQNAGISLETLNAGMQLTLKSDASPVATETTAQNKNILSLVSVQAPQAKPESLPLSVPSATALEAMLAKIQLASAAKQTGFSPLFALLSQVANPQTTSQAASKPATPPTLSPALPAEVRQIARQILSFSLGTNTPLTQEKLLKMLQNSGVFYEAAAQKAEPQSMNDFKSALLTLRDALKHHIKETTQQTATPQNYTAPPHRAQLPPMEAASTPAVMPQTQQETLQTLLSHTEGALERMTLLQLASSPEHLNNTGNSSQNIRHTVLEIPIQTAQGIAFAGLHITREPEEEKTERDSSKQDKNKQPRWKWNAIFSFILEPLGALHVQISLREKDLKVTLWGEQEATAQALHHTRTDLEDALLAADFNSLEMHVAHGTPKPLTQSHSAYTDLHKAHFINKTL